jgi:hypothetical protein
MIFKLHVRYPTFLGQECMNCNMNHCKGYACQLDKYIVPKILEKTTSGPDLMHLNEKKKITKDVDSLSTIDYSLSYETKNDLLFNAIDFFSFPNMEDDL